MSNVAPYRVLCLDGGGMRGVYTATYLQGLEEIFARRRGLPALDVGTGFDLICGTSTGAIVGAALAHGVPMADVSALYVEHGHAIFPRRLPKSAGLKLIADLFARRRALKSGNAALRNALEARLGDTTFAELYRNRGIALAFPAVALANHRSWVFKTPHLPGSSHRDDPVRLVDACLASSAAPIFRSIAMIDNTVVGNSTPQAFVDGGLWANNPVLVGLIDALDATDDGRRIEIFCLGTVPVPTGQNVGPRDVDRGLVGWQFGGAAAGLSIDAQQFAYDKMAEKIARHVRRDCQIFRFPADGAPAALLPYLGLDDTREEAIRALRLQASSDANLTNAECGKADSRTGIAIRDLFMDGHMRPVQARTAAM